MAVDWVGSVIEPLVVLLVPTVGGWLIWIGTKLFNQYKSTDDAKHAREEDAAAAARLTEAQTWLDEAVTAAVKSVEQSRGGENGADKKAFALSGVKLHLGAPRWKKLLEAFGYTDEELVRVIGYKVDAGVFDLKADAARAANAVPVVVTVPSLPVTPAAVPVSLAVPPGVPPVKLTP